MVRADPGSFRDPSGHVYWEHGEVYRQINKPFHEEYRLFVDSGLYEELVNRGMLIRHTEVSADDEAIHIKPEQVPFISYPYEWTFSQYQDAALLTLDIQRLALKYGMTLKDASAFNVTFHKGKPIFIDTLSFEKFDNKPWQAYGQFCRHFLAPLVLMSRVDIGFGKALKLELDGIDLSLASKLLSPWTKLKLSYLLHIHLHAKSSRRYAGNAQVKVRKISQHGICGLIDNLKTMIAKLKWLPQGTEWADYYDNTNYAEASFAAKESLVKEYVNWVQPATIWDLGANDGHFSRVAQEASERSSVIAFDIDPAAVEKNYLRGRERKEDQITPLVLDLMNPSASIGWAGTERLSLSGRGGCDLVVALALIHHLCITNNVPLENVAQYFATLGRHLLIEFVPKEDSQVVRLLSTRPDIFPNYTKAGFESAFLKHFKLVKKQNITNTERTLYLLASA